MRHLAREIGILGTFITCMYFAFAYGSILAGIGAVIAFLSVGNKHEDV